MREILESLLDGQDLSEQEAGSLLDGMTDVEVDPAVKGAVLAAMRAKGPTGQELRGMALAMREASHKIRLPPGDLVVDTCGTGGDGFHSFNVSTASALVVAAAGVKVVKHGNRSVSSKCGSADVLEAMGISLVNSPERALEALDDSGFTFLFAPAFHPAMKAVVPVRRALGIRTVFNMLGPLSNPAAPPYQLVGAYSVDAAWKLAEALSGMPIERCFVVHGYPGYDEATPCGAFLRLDVTPGEISEREIDPFFTYGIPRCTPDDLAGGDKAHNAEMMRNLFAGVHNAVRHAVMLNAALVLELIGWADTPKEALALAEDVLDSGRGQWFLNKLGVET